MAQTEDSNFNEIINEIEKEEKGSKPTAKPESASTKKGDSEIEYPHVEIMEEEGLERKDLPEDLQKMILSFERKKAMAIRRKAKEETFIEISNLSTIIADKIMDWLEEVEESEMELENEKESTDQETEKELENELIMEGNEGETPNIANVEEVTDVNETTETPSDVNDGSSVESSEEVTVVENGDDSVTLEPKKKVELFDGVLGGIFNW